MKLLKKRILSPIDLTLPCDLCNAKVDIVSVYLQAKANRKIPKGFYSDLLIHLCKKCIKTMLTLFT